MSEVTEELFNSYKHRAIDPREITDIPTCYLMFWDLNADAEKQFPELVGRSPDGHPFVFDNWLISTWYEKDKTYYTIGPIRQGIFDPTYLIDVEDYGKSFFAVKKV